VHSSTLSRYFRYFRDIRRKSRTRREPLFDLIAHVVITPYFRPSLTSIPRSATFAKFRHRSYHNYDSYPMRSGRIIYILVTTLYSDSVPTRTDTHRMVCTRFGRHMSHRWYSECEPSVVAWLPIPFIVVSFLYPVFRTWTLLKHLQFSILPMMRHIGLLFRFIISVSVYKRLGFSPQK
jgi:hypothetical protein